MINAKLILPVVLTIVTSLTCVSATKKAGNNDMDTCPVIAVQHEEKLSEKLETGEITQEQYDEIIAAIESRDFTGNWANRGNAKELNDEQKTEIAEKHAEAAANRNFGAFRGGMRGNFGTRNR